MLLMLHFKLSKACSVVKAYDYACIDLDNYQWQNSFFFLHKFTIKHIRVHCIYTEIRLYVVYLHVMLIYIPYITGKGKSWEQRNIIDSKKGFSALLRSRIVIHITSIPLLMTAFFFNTNLRSNLPIKVSSMSFL